MNFVSDNKNYLALPVFAMALCASLNAQAVPIASPVVSGTPCTVYAVTAPGILTATTCTPANVVTALTGNAADPTGNVELGRFASSPATTLSGTLGGSPITLSGLVLADFTANANALATAYIQGAAQATFGAPLNATDLNTALTIFFTFNLQPPGLGTLFPYQLVSDPNISYVNLDSGVLHIGLAGLLDATPILQTLFPAALFPSVTIPPGSQASEIVKFTFNGVNDYHYGFFATPSGYHTSTFPADQSYTGNYDTPIPGVMWLLGAGLVALRTTRRRR